MWETLQNPHIRAVGKRFHALINRAVSARESQNKPIDVLGRRPKLREVS